MLVVATRDQDRDSQALGRDHKGTEHQQLDEDISGEILT
jgi:hypothetical protein